jgi:hypothetical protein
MMNKEIELNLHLVNKDYIMINIIMNKINILNQIHQGHLLYSILLELHMEIYLKIINNNNN